MGTLSASFIQKFSVFLISYGAPTMTRAVFLTLFEPGVAILPPIFQNLLLLQIATLLLIVVLRLLI